MFNKNIFKLSIIDFRIWVHLVCTEEEKVHPQMVSFNIDLCFKVCPQGAYTDNLKDVVCYLKIVELITVFCQGKCFNVVEHLTESIYKAIFDYLNSFQHLIQLIKIEIRKVSPPVPNIHGGISWTYYINFINRPLAEFASAREFVGDTESRPAAYLDVREDSSTGSMHKLPAEVELRKRS
ncbi:MAG: dihydroneopterin aldolase [Candidatus Tisiphia sp.]